MENAQSLRVDVRWSCMPRRPRRPTAGAAGRAVVGDTMGDMDRSSSEGSWDDQWLDAQIAKELAACPPQPTSAPEPGGAVGKDGPGGGGRRVAWGQSRAEARARARAINNLPELGADSQRPSKDDSSGQSGSDDAIEGLQRYMEARDAHYVALEAQMADDLRALPALARTVATGSSESKTRPQPEPEPEPQPRRSAGDDIVSCSSDDLEDFEVSATSSPTASPARAASSNAEAVQARHAALQRDFHAGKPVAPPPPPPTQAIR